MLFKKAFFYILLLLVVVIFAIGILFSAEILWRSVSPILRDSLVNDAEMFPSNVFLKQPAEITTQKKYAGTANFVMQGYLRAQTQLEKKAEKHSFLFISAVPALDGASKHFIFSEGSVVAPFIYALF